MSFNFKLISLIIINQVMQIYIDTVEDNMLSTPFAYSVLGLHKFVLKISAEKK